MTLVHWHIYDCPSVAHAFISTISVFKILGSTEVVLILLEYLASHVDKGEITIWIKHFEMIVMLSLSWIIKTRPVYLIVACVTVALNCRAEVVCVAL